MERIAKGSKLAQQLDKRLEYYRSLRFKDVPDVSHFGEGFNPFMELSHTLIAPSGSSDVSNYLYEEHGDIVSDIIVHPRSDRDSTLIFIREPENHQDHQAAVQAILR